MDLSPKSIQELRDEELMHRATLPEDMRDIAAQLQDPEIPAQIRTEMLEYIAQRTIDEQEETLEDLDEEMMEETLQYVSQAKTHKDLLPPRLLEDLEEMEEKTGISLPEGEGVLEAAIEAIQRALPVEKRQSSSEIMEQYDEVFDTLEDLSDLFEAYDYHFESIKGGIIGGLQARLDEIQELRKDLRYTKFTMHLAQREGSGTNEIFQTLRDKKHSFTANVMILYAVCRLPRDTIVEIAQKNTLVQDKIKEIRELFFQSLTATEKLYLERQVLMSLHNPRAALELFDRESLLSEALEEERYLEEVPDQLMTTALAHYIDKDAPLTEAEQDILITASATVKCMYLLGEMNAATHTLQETNEKAIMYAKREISLKDYFNIIWQGFFQETGKSGQEALLKTLDHIAAGIQSSRK